MKETLKENILADEKKLWEQALFVFDSSALLNFYEYSEKTRQEIFEAVFKKLVDRLWLTNHTEYEYLKNRVRVLLRPKKLYDDLLNSYFDGKHFESFKSQFSQLLNRTKKDDKHPHFEEEFFQQFQNQLSSFDSELQKFMTELKEKVKTKKAEIDSTQENDSLREAIYQYFQITEGYDFNKLIEIAKEGDFRYKNQIPPGYEDVKEKIGLAVYGDLVIWKQILTLAKKENKPVILIIDDLKIDWCYQDSKDKNVVDSPREELIKEFQDFCGNDFWLYSSTQFLQKSTQYLATTIGNEVIEEVNQSNQFSNKIVGRPYLEVDLIWTSGGRWNRGFSNKNPIEMHDGQPVMVVTEKPIIYWGLNWYYKLVVHNNSNYPAYNIKVESIGSEHFAHLDELPKINNIPPLSNVTLEAKYEDTVEGDHAVADAMVNSRIPEKFKNLILKVTYFDEGRNLYTNYVRFSGSEILNSET